MFLSMPPPVGGSLHDFSIGVPGSVATKSLRTGQPGQQIGIRNPGICTAFVEKRRRRHHAGAYPGAEVAIDACGDSIGAPVALEGIQVESELLAAPPEVGIVEVALVGEQRAVHLPERALERGGLESVGEHSSTRMLRDHREVTEDTADRPHREQLVRLRAVGTLEVRILDYERAVAPYVVVLADRRDRVRAETAVRR